MSNDIEVNFEELPQNKTVVMHVDCDPLYYKEVYEKAGETELAKALAENGNRILLMPKFTSIDVLDVKDNHAIAIYVDLDIIPADQRMNFIVQTNKSLKSLFPKNHILVLDSKTCKEVKVSDNASD